MKLNRENYRHYIEYIFLLILGLTPIIWFWGKGDVLINGVDTNFPLNPLLWFGRRFFAWNNILNGGADFSSSIAGLFFHLIQVVPYVLGFKLQLVELISLLFWFLLIIGSSFVFAKIIFPKRMVSRLLFVVFYSFNIYFFNTWENVKVANLSLVSAIPLALAILTLLNRKKISSKIGILFSILTGILLSGAGINPSYFLTFFVVIFIYFVGDFLSGDLLSSESSRIEKLKNLLIVVSTIILTNLFWILPTTNYIVKTVPSGESIDKIGFTNWIDSLSENTSILNVMRLQGAWDWYSFDSVTGLPLYIPYVLNFFYRFPFIVFSFVLPVLAILSLAFRKKGSSGLYLSFSLMLLAGIFLGVGTHLPTGFFYRLLLNHFPFFSLFRSPWYIFTPLVFLAYAGLVGLFFDRLYDLSFIKKLYLGNRTVTFLGFVLLVGNLIYCYPLVSGKIYRPGKSDGFYISFPGYVYDAGKWLLRNKVQGRVMVYPDEEIEKFNWGYRGIESILQLLANKELLYPPLNAPDSPVALLAKEFYLNLKKHQLSSAMSVASKLNVSTIFVKNDQESLSPAVPNEIKSLQSHTFGQWDFYSLPRELILPKIYPAKNIFYSYPYLGNKTVISALEKDDQVINPDDKIINSITNISDFSGKILLAKNLQLENYLEFANSVSKLSNRIVSRDFSKVDYEIEIPEEGYYQPQLERYSIQDFGINNTVELKVEVNGNKEFWTIDHTSDSYIIFKSTNLKKGKYRISLELNNKNLIIGGDFEEGEKFKRGGYGEGGVFYEINEGENGKYLTLHNLGRAEQSSDFTVSDFDYFFPYYVEVEYKQIYGNNAQIVVGQNTPTTLIKAQTERLPNYPEWQKFSFYYQPIQTKSDMKVFLVSPYIKDPLGTKILYDNLIVKKVFSNNLFFTKKSKDLLVTPKIDIGTNSPVLYEGVVREAIGPHLIIFSENYSPDWQIRLTDLQGNPIVSAPKHFSINLFANAWYFESSPESYKFKIYYKPQNLFYLGMGTTVLFIISALGYYCFYKFKGEKKNNGKN